MVEDLASAAIAWWLGALAALVLLATFLARSWRLQKLTENAGHAQLQYGVALRSALVYVAMAVPPILLRCTELEAGQVTLHSWGACTASPYGILPTNLMRGYHWLPFWYACLVTTHLGICIASAYDAICGSAIGLLALSFLNCLAPGGAGAVKQGIKDAELGWLPGGYSTAFVLLYAFVLVHGLFFSRISLGAKQYGLGVFAAGIVPFMNPDTTRGFRAVLFDWNFEWNWNGPMMCEVWVVLVAVLLSFVSLGLVPCSRRSRESHTCLGSAAKALSELSADTSGCLEWMATTCCRDPYSFDIDSSFYYVRQLGSRRTAVEGLLAHAPWECFGTSSRKRLQRLQRFCDLLRSLRQALRVELQQARALRRKALQALADEEVQRLLDEYLASCREALSSLSTACCEGEGVAEACQSAKAAAKSADEALVRALGLMQASSSSADEAAFVDRLRSWSGFVERTAECLAEEDASPAPALPSVPSKHPGGDSWKDRHWYAERNRLSWMLALLWSLYIRGFSSGCVVSVSFIFSATSGSSFDKNINRMVGIGLGLGVGSVPALLVMQGATLDGGESQVFVQGLTIYLVVMFLMWAMAMYGYLAPGSKYSYACLLWVGYSGTQMLRHVPKYDRARGLILDVIDNMMACLIIFIVDIVWAYVSGTSTSEQARSAAALCVEDAAAVAEALEDAKAKAVTDLNVAEFQEHIKTARFWDGEIRQEGLIWTGLWETPYKAELVHALLDHCDDVMVAAFAIQASARRCASTAQAAELAAHVLGGGLTARCQQQARSARAVLEGTISQEVARELLIRPCKLEVIQADSAPKIAEGAAPEERAAALAVWISAQALQASLQRIGRLLATRAALDSRDWRAADQRPMYVSRSISCDDSAEAFPPRLPSSPPAELRRRR